MYLELPLYQHSSIGVHCKQLVSILRPVRQLIVEHKKPHRNYSKDRHFNYRFRSMRVNISFRKNDKCFNFIYITNVSIEKRHNFYPFWLQSTAIQLFKGTGRASIFGASLSSRILSFSMVLFDRYS